MSPVAHLQTLKFLSLFLKTTVLLDTFKTVSTLQQQLSTQSGFFEYTDTLSTSVVSLLKQNHLVYTFCAKKLIVFSFSPLDSAYVDTVKFDHHHHHQLLLLLRSLEPSCPSFTCTLIEHRETNNSQKGLSTTKEQSSLVSQSLPSYLRLSHFLRSFEALNIKVISLIRPLISFI